MNVIFFKIKKTIYHFNQKKISRRLQENYLLNSIWVYLYIYILEHNLKMLITAMTFNFKL